MAEITVRLPDGSATQVADGTTALEFAETISRRLGREALAVEIDGTPRDLRARLTHDALVVFHSFESPVGRDAYRHTAAHVLAQAVKRLRPDAKVTIGPPIDDGFYYDFDTEPFRPEDLEQIEEEMRRILAEDHATQRAEVSREEAYKLFDDMGEPYKREILDDIPDEDVVSIYMQGEFTDLCRGPHVPSPGRIKYVKLLSTGGAYWRGDECNTQLQRIYGTAFDRKSDLEEHLRRLEEAERRDHRRLGTQLDLYSTHENLGGGLILWHPKGAFVRHLIEDFWRQRHLEGGYEFVYSPHIGKSDLWKTSGHLEFFAENMYSPIDLDGQEYYIKPMNCPFHILIYKNRQHSYRELPKRFAELGTVYRYERAGVLHGLMRVRGFTQDDAHLFCRESQMPDEIDRVLNFCLDILRAFGFAEFEAFLSTRPEKAVGGTEQWTAAEGALRSALERSGLDFRTDDGAGTFYGPKIDLKIRDALNRSWQCSTIQFDFNLPERFDISYIGEDGREHRPYMVHRALLGSIERFFGILVEHYGGAFPMWLAPDQATILTITDAHRPYAAQVEETLKAAGLRVATDLRGEKLGLKIREAQLSKVPYMLIVGDKEAAAGAVATRTRQGEDIGAMPIDAFIQRAQEDISARR